MAKLGLIWPWQSEVDFRPWTAFNYVMAKLMLLIWPRHSEVDSRPWTAFNYVMAKLGLIWPWQNEVDFRPWTAFNYVMAKLELLIWPWHSEVDSQPWTAFNGPKPTPHRYMTCTCDCIYSFNLLLMMGAESTRNMYSKFALNNKDDYLKLHHVGYLINICRVCLAQFMVWCQLNKILTKIVSDYVVCT
jgi:hypothetical protein